MTVFFPILAVFAVLACHWLGLLVIRALFMAVLSRLGPKGAWGEDLSFGVAIFALIAWLFLDVAFCALILSWLNADIGFINGFLFAIANFTTVGAASPTSSPFWSLAGPLIAMCGIFIFGWTTSFLVDCSHGIRDFRTGRNQPPSRFTNW